MCMRGVLGIVGVVVGDGVLFIIMDGRKHYCCCCFCCLLLSIFDRGRLNSVRDDGDDERIRDQAKLLGSVV